MWVQRGGPPQPLGLLDGDEGYAAVCDTEGIVQLGCFAHARRKFDGAIKAQGKTSSKTKGSKASKGLNFMGKLYAIERTLKDSTPEAPYRARQAQAKPIIEAMKVWLDTSIEQLPRHQASVRPPITAIGTGLNSFAIWMTGDYTLITSWWKTLFDRLP